MAHAAQSRDLAEGLRNRSIARRARCGNEKRQLGELGGRQNSDESWRSARRECPRGSKAASISKDLGELAEVDRKMSFF